MLKRVRVAGLIGFCLFAGCGDDDGGSKVSSGLPPNEKLSALDSADAQKLCMSLSDGLNGILTETERKRIACTVLAVPLSVTEVGGEVAGDVSKCQMLVSKCMGGEKISSQPPEFELPDSFVDENQCSAANASSNLDGCDASVSEFENCADAIIGALDAQLAILDCKSLSNPEMLKNMDSSGLELDSQPACKPLGEKCPEIDFGG
jgi:hypothetical protein